MHALFNHNLSSFSVITYPLLSLLHHPTASPPQTTTIAATAAVVIHKVAKQKKMPKILQKTFYHCLPSFKCLPTILSLRFEETEEEKTEHKKIKNFNSVFDIPSSDSATTSKSLTNSSIATTEEEDNNTNYTFTSFEDSDHTNIPDFSNIFDSQRFFFSSPGNSNSIIDFPPEKPKVVTGGVAVQTYSPDPYSDFRRSMQEMVEAHELTNVKANWEFLHELLLCYLNLNPKHTHKYIIGAYSDLVVSLMSIDDSEKIKKTEGTARPREQTTIVL